MLTTEAVMLAKLMRRDVEPDEQRVKVRVRTHSGGHTWRGYYFSHGDRTEVDSRMPIRAGWCEVEMFPSHLADLEREVAANAAKPVEIDRAVHDLKNHILDVDPKRNVDVMTSEELLSMIASGDLQGTTKRPHRPAFAVSFAATNRRELHPILSIEKVEEKAATVKR
jgi:hypothetical protein